MGLFNFGRKFDGTIDFHDEKYWTTKEMKVIWGDDQLVCFGKGSDVIIPMTDLKSIGYVTQDALGYRYGLDWKDGRHALLILKFRIPDGYINGKNWIYTKPMKVYFNYSQFDCWPQDESDHDNYVKISKDNLESIEELPSTQFYKYKITLKDGHWCVAELMCNLTANDINMLFHGYY